MGENDEAESIGATNPIPLSDRVLLARFQEGEEDAATAIYLRYAKRLKSLATKQAGKALGVRLDEEDVVQSVFRTFFRRAAKGWYDIPDGEDLWKLLLVIALNKVRKLGEYHRAEKRDVSRTVSFLNMDVRDRANAEPFYCLLLTIEELMEALSDSEREIIFLRIEGNSVKEISAKTSRAQRTVERVLQRFRRRVADAIEE